MSDGSKLILVTRMDDRTRIMLLKQMVSDFWSFYFEDRREGRAVAYLEVIRTVLLLGGDDDEAD